MSEITQQVDTWGVRARVFVEVDNILQDNGYPLVARLDGAGRLAHPLFASSATRDNMIGLAIHQRSVALQALFGRRRRQQAEVVIQTRQDLIKLCLNTEAMQERPSSGILYRGVKALLGFEGISRPTHAFVTPAVTEAILECQDPGLAADYLERMLAEAKRADASGWLPLEDELGWFADVKAQIPPGHPVLDRMSALEFDPGVMVEAVETHEQTA